MLFSPKLFLVLPIVALLASCATQPSTPVFTEYPAPVHPVDKGSNDSAFQKSYETHSDWSGDGWVVKRGATITFNADGTGVFNAVVYAQPGVQLPNAIQFQSNQYGADDNLLFGVPGSDVGQSLHLRTPLRDYPYTLRFGFNRDYYETISSVRFRARFLCHSGLSAQATPVSGQPSK